MPNIKDLYNAALTTYPAEPKIIDPVKLTEPPPTQSALRARLRSALNVAADPLALAQIATRLVEEAKLGNQGAMKLLFELLQGKPETVDTDAVKPILSPAEVERTLKELGYERKR